MTNRHLALGITLGLAILGCAKTKTESLVVVEVKAEPPASGSVMAKVTVGDVPRSFTVDGLGASAVRLGVYVPDGTVGLTGVSVQASTASGCWAGATTVVIDKAGVSVTAMVTVTPVSCAGASGADGGITDAGASDGSAADRAGDASTVAPDVGSPDVVIPPPPSLQGQTCKLFQSKDDTPPNCDPTSQSTDFAVRAVAFSPDGKILAASTSFIGGMTAEWNVDGSFLNWRETDIGQNFLARLAFSPDGALLAGAGESGQITTWKIPGWTSGFSLGGSDTKINYSFLAWSPDSSRFVTAEPTGGFLKIWTVAGGATQAPTQAATAPVGFAAASRAPTAGGPWWVAVVSTDFRASFIDLNVDPPKATKDFGVSSNVLAIALSEDANTLAVAGEDGLCIWDVTRKDAPIPQAPCLKSLGFGNQFYAVAFSPSGHHLVATVGDFRAVGIYSVDKLKELGSIITLGYAQSVAFSPDGRAIVAGKTCGNILYCRD